MKKLLLFIAVAFAVTLRAEETAIFTLSDAERQELNELKVYDPWEPMNRVVYKFNYQLDKYILIPAVDAYKYVLPDPVETGVSNFFSNLGEITNFINSVVQLEFKDAGKTFGRFAVNTTVGIAGVFDVATGWDMKENPQNFGKTLKHYGVGPGPYLVLPGFGPSNLRNGVGIGVDYAIVDAIDLFNFNDQNDEYQIPFTIVSIINARRNVDYRYYEMGTPFEYDAVKFIYGKVLDPPSYLETNEHETYKENE